MKARLSSSALPHVRPILSSYTYTIYLSHTNIFISLILNYSLAQYLVFSHPDIHFHHPPTQLTNQPYSTSDRWSRCERHFFIFLFLQLSKENNKEKLWTPQKINLKKTGFKNIKKKKNYVNIQTQVITIILSTLKIYLTDKNFDTIFYSTQWLYYWWKIFILFLVI